MIVALGADHAGYRLKDVVKPYIETLGHQVVDLGCHDSDSVDYPDFALEVCNKVISGEVNRGILICGTGIGMSISANKVTGIRCALVHDMFSAIATREHNNTNVLAMGERVIGPGIAQEIIRLWLDTPFSEGVRHQNRIDKLTKIEQTYMK
jgi:ribose 5-phosphate isomerase B